MTTLTVLLVAEVAVATLTRARQTELLMFCGLSGVLLLTVLPWTREERARVGRVRWLVDALLLLVLGFVTLALAFTPTH